MAYCKDCLHYEVCKHHGCVVEFEVDDGVCLYFVPDTNVGEWIPVTDRLPEYGSRVIACGEKGGVFMVRSEGKNTGFGKMDGGSKYRSFTHWMPLPEPPKEDL